MLPEFGGDADQAVFAVAATRHNTSPRNLPVVRDIIWFSPNEKPIALVPVVFRRDALVVVAGHLHRVRANLRES